MSKTKPRGSDATLDEQLLEIVSQSGMTINAVAVAAGIPEPVLYRFAHGGQKSIRLDNADKLARYFGFGFTKPKFPKGRKEPRQ
jgi:plasmid maintenance system antidote protein VapI